MRPARQAAHPSGEDSFGDILQNTAEMRQIIGNIGQDFSFALRILRRSPSLSAVIVLSLAIGIGANTAIFSVAETILLRPLPYADVARLALLWVRSPAQGINQDWLSPGEYLDIRNRSQVFQELAIARGDSFNLTGRANPERVEGLRVNSRFFPVLGARALFGSIPGDEIDQPGGPLNVVMTYSVWRRLFDGNRAVIGRSLTLNGRVCTIVAVLQRGFSLTSDELPVVGGAHAMEIFVPLQLGPNAAANRSEEAYNVIGLLRPGISLERAQSEVAGIAAQIRRQDRRDPSFNISVVPLTEQVTGKVRRALLVLLASVGLVLLVACANVANLLLARAVTRSRETAVRISLGATPGSLIRQLMMESLLLSGAGGIAGILVAWLLIQSLGILAPGSLPRTAEIGINGTVLAFTFTISLVSGLAFGLVPAFRIAELDLHTCLKAGSRSVHSGQLSARFRGILVIAELAFCLILLAAAGLMLRSFARLQTVSPGFNPENVISLRLSLRWPRYRSRDEILRFAAALQDRLGKAPGLRAFATISDLPMTAGDGWGGLDVEGMARSADQPELQADLRAASPDYFRTLKIPLLAGRGFTAFDTNSAPGVAIVDAKAARRIWPGQSPLGRRVRIGTGKASWSTIVGVAGTVKQNGLDAEPRMAVYFPQAQLVTDSFYVVARTNADPATEVTAITREIRAIDPDLPVYDISTMPDRISKSLARPRFALTLLAAFATFALILAGIGVYGVISYLVSQSTRELGVRMALGAQRADILRSVLRRGLILGIAGVAAGLAGAMLLTRLMRAMLFEVSPSDPLTLIGVSLFLLFVAAAASLVPAVRASNLDPTAALRDE